MSHSHTNGGRRYDVLSDFRGALKHIERVDSGNDLLKIFENGTASQGGGADLELVARAYIAKFANGQFSIDERYMIDDPRVATHSVIHYENRALVEKLLRHGLEEVYAVRYDASSGIPVCLNRNQESLAIKEICTVLCYAREHELHEKCTGRILDAIRALPGHFKLGVRETELQNILVLRAFDAAASRLLVIERDFRAAVEKSAEIVLRFLRVLRENVARA